MTEESRVYSGHRFIVSVIDHSGDVVIVASDAPELKGAYRTLKTYELHDDGSLGEYKEPERLFSYTFNGCINAPIPQSRSAFAESYEPYYELIDGNFIRLSDEQLAELRNKAKGKS